MKRRILLFVGGIAISAITIDAHHSISGVYDSNQQVKIEGVVAEFHFVNPHPFLTMDVQAGNDTKRWRLEMDNRSELADVGVTSETLKPGDRIVVTGSPARAQSQSLYVRRLDRPVDGFWYEQVGTSPRIGTQGKR
jgi:hypothetical protein